MKLFPWLKLAQIIEYKRAFIKKKIIVNVDVDDYQLQKNNKHSRIVDLHHVHVHGFVIKQGNKSIVDHLKIFKVAQIRIKFVDIDGIQLMDIMKTLNEYKVSIIELDMCMVKVIPCDVLNEICNFMKMCENLETLGIYIGGFTQKMVEKITLNIPKSVKKMFVNDLAYNNKNLNFVVDNCHVQHMKFYRTIQDLELSKKIVDVMKWTGIYIDCNVHALEYKNYVQIVELNKLISVKVIILILHSIKLFKNYPELACSLSKLL